MLLSYCSLFACWELREGENTFSVENSQSETGTKMKSHEKNKTDEFHMELISSNIVSHRSHCSLCQSNLEPLPIVIIEIKFTSTAGVHKRINICTNTKELQIEWLNFCILYWLKYSIFGIIVTHILNKKNMKNIEMMMMMKSNK